MTGWTCPTSNSTCVRLLLPVSAAAARTVVGRCSHLLGTILHDALELRALEMPAAVHTAMSQKVVSVPYMSQSAASLAVHARLGVGCAALGSVGSSRRPVLRLRCDSLTVTVRTKNRPTGPVSRSL